MAYVRTEYVEVRMEYVAVIGVSFTYGALRTIRTTYYKDYLYYKYCTAMASPPRIARAARVFMSGMFVALFWIELRLLLAVAEKASAAESLTLLLDVGFGESGPSPAANAKLDSRDSQIAAHEASHQEGQPQAAHQARVQPLSATGFGAFTTLCAVRIWA